MVHRKLHGLGVAIVAVCLVLGSVAIGQAAGRTITLGWTSWADAEFMIHLVKQQIEAHTDVTVKPQKLTIAVQYQAVAHGDIDGIVMAWLPDTHKHYWQQVHNDVVDLGAMYSGARVGWAVPDYVSDDIQSMADLASPDVAAGFNHTVVGIDPGAGEMRESRAALKAYGLQAHYTLKAGNESTMTSALARAIKAKQPILVTLWTPHWAFGKWHLRFLTDPKGVFGGAQHVDAVVRKGFPQEYPEVARFLSNIHIPIKDLQQAMYYAQKRIEKQGKRVPMLRLHGYMTSVHAHADSHARAENAAVEWFVKHHPRLVASWWQGIRRAAAPAGKPGM